MIVYVVEHRIQHLKTNTFENVVMNVASSLEKAKKWCQNNLDVEDKVDDKPWWFAIFQEEVDSSELIPDTKMTIISWDGTEIVNQPVSGY